MKEQYHTLLSLKVQYDGNEKNYKHIPKDSVILEKGSYFSLTNKSSEMLKVEFAINIDEWSLLRLNTIMI